MNWKEQLREEYKADKTVNLFSDDVDGLNNLVKTLTHQQRMLGEKRIKPITDSSTEQEIIAFRNAMGIPATKEEYELDEPIALRIHGANYTPAQAKILKEILTEVRGDPQKTEAAIKEKYGDNYTSTVESLKAFVSRVAPEGSAEAIAATLGNNKDLFDFLVEVSRKTKIKEESFDDREYKAAVGKDEAAAKFKALKADPNFIRAIRDRRDPGHRAALENYERLAKLVNGT